jgi:hypothetical protein
MWECSEDGAEGAQKRKTPLDKMSRGVYNAVTHHRESQALPAMMSHGIDDAPHMRIG